MLYLNAAGLSPFHPDVQREITRVHETFGRLLYSEPGIQLYRETLEKSRETIAHWLGLNNTQHFTFVPNTTTACHLTLSRINWQPGDTLLTTTHENSTILNEIHSLRNRGVLVVSLDPESPTGLLSAFEQALQKHPVRALVISHVSHLDGRIFPLEKLQKMAHSHHAMLIADGAQAVGHIPISFQNFQPHAYFFPGHKWCAGPMGTGALILSEEFIRMLAHPNDLETSQEIQQFAQTHFELGTQHLGLIAGFAKACDMKHQEGIDHQALDEIRKEWETRFREYPGIGILDWNGAQAPGILSCVCLDEQTETFMQSKAATHSLAWKTFTHPSFPSRLCIRLSWTQQIPQIDIQTALAFFPSHKNA